MSPDLLFTLIVVGFLLGAIPNLKRFRAYALITLILVTPFYSTMFMPREVLGITGLNFWNLIWLIAVGASLAPASRTHHGVRGPSYFGLPMTLFVAALLLATLYGMWVANDLPQTGSAGPRTALTVLMTGWLKPMQFMVLGWLVYRHCLATRDVRPISRAIMASVIIFGGMVLYFYMEASRGGYVDPYGTYVVGRDAVSAMSGMHANDVGAWATYGLVFAVLWRETSGPWPYVRRAAIVIAVLTVVFSFSRTAYVVAPLALLLALKKIGWKEKVAAMLVVAVVVVYTAPLLIERASYRTETRDLNQISAGRIDGIWKPLWKDVEEHPLFGDGRFAQLRSKSYSQIRLSHAHSAYLHILLEMGAAGLLVVFGMLARLFLVGRAANSALPFLLFVSCMVGIMGHSFVPDASNFLIWVVYGTSLAVIALSRVGVGEDAAVLRDLLHTGFPASQRGGGSSRRVSGLLRGQGH